jgi:hypothetical protein
MSAIPTTDRSPEGETVVPLKLNVGVSRMVGLPDYGSVGASCNVEVELDSTLLERDLDAFHARVRGAYVAAHQAVQDELARLHAPVAEPQDAPAAPPRPASNGQSGGNGHANRTPAGRSRLRKPATENQGPGDPLDRQPAARRPRWAPARVRRRPPRGPVAQAGVPAD